MLFKLIILIRLAADSINKFRWQIHFDCFMGLYVLIDILIYNALELYYICIIDCISGISLPLIVNISAAITIAYTQLRYIKSYTETNFCKNI